MLSRDAVIANAIWHIISFDFKSAFDKVPHRVVIYLSIHETTSVIVEKFLENSRLKMSPAVLSSTTQSLIDKEIWLSRVFSLLPMYEWKLWRLLLRTRRDSWLRWWLRFAALIVIQADLQSVKSPDRFAANHFFCLARENCTICLACMSVADRGVGKGGGHKFMSPPPCLEMNPFTLKPMIDILISLQLTHIRTHTHTQHTYTHKHTQMMICAPNLVTFQRTQFCFM